MLGISALNMMTLGMCSADRKFAPDGSCCGSYWGQKQDEIIGELIN